MEGRNVLVEIVDENGERKRRRVGFYSSRGRVYMGEDGVGGGTFFLGVYDSILPNLLFE